MDDTSAAVSKVIQSINSGYIVRGTIVIKEEVSISTLTCSDPRKSYGVLKSKT